MPENDTAYEDLKKVAELLKQVMNLLEPHVTTAVKTGKWWPLVAGVIGTVVGILIGTQLPI